MTRVLFPTLLLVLGAAACIAPEPLPVFAQVPAFSLTERSGRTVTSDDLAGRPYIVDFVFTTCAGPCPLLSQNMERLQDELGGHDVQLVSITVDPERDTPEALTRYARRYGADPDRWLFLTGDKQAIYDLVRGGFLLAIDDGAISPDGTPGPGIITHSTKFVLVDAEGQIRAFYSGEESSIVEEVLDGLDRLGV